MSEKEPWIVFKYEHSQKWIDKWVATVAYPELQWAWDVTLGTIDLYASLSVTRKEPLDVKRRELWYDWFESWEGGDAHFGIHAAMQEFVHACPEGREAEQLLVIGEAYALGTGTVPEKAPKVPAPSGIKVLPFTVLKGGKA